MAELCQAAKAEAKRILDAAPRRVLEERLQPGTAGLEREARVVHCQRDPYDVYIGRAVPRRGLKASKWGNPYREGVDGTLAECIAKYEHEHLSAHPELEAALPELRGKVLGCWCAPKPCHGDVLVRLANGGDE
jgi:hypothetical protein